MNKLLTIAILFAYTGIFAQRTTLPNTATQSPSNKNLNNLNGQLIQNRLVVNDSAWFNGVQNLFPNGNVGIGTIAPTGRLHVASSLSGAHLFSVADSGTITMGVDTNNFNFVPDFGISADFISGTDTVIFLSSGFGFFSEITDSSIYSRIENVVGRVSLRTSSTNAGGNNEYLRLRLNGQDGSISVGDGASPVVDIATWDTSGAWIFTANSLVSFLGTTTYSYATSNVTNPPTDAELDALYGTPATVGDGFTAKVKDSDSNNLYEVVAVGSSWYTFSATLAP